MNTGNSMRSRSQLLAFHSLKPKFKADDGFSPMKTDQNGEIRETIRKIEVIIRYIPRMLNGLASHEYQGFISAAHSLAHFSNLVASVSFASMTKYTNCRRKTWMFASGTITYTCKSVKLRSRLASRTNTSTVSHSISKSSFVLALYFTGPPNSANRRSSFIKFASVMTKGWGIWMV